MCEFCKLLENSGRIILQNQMVFAMLTNIPIVPGHILICPTRHVEKINELAEDELKEIFKTVFAFKSIFEKLFGAQGYNFAWNEGKIAGQNIPHLHLHMLPRKQGDAGIVEYEPRKFLYRPGSRETSPELELNDLVKLIREELNGKSTI